jgi:hypothetical protein
MKQQNSIAELAGNLGVNTIGLGGTNCTFGALYKAASFNQSTLFLAAPGRARKRSLYFHSLTIEMQGKVSCSLVAQFLAPSTCANNSANIKSIG